MFVWLDVAPLHQGVGVLFGVQVAICDTLSTTEDVGLLEAGYNGLTSVLQAHHIHTWLRQRVLCP